MEGHEDVKKILQECNQSHILAFWSDLSKEQQKEFLQQLRSINFKEACKMWEKAQEDSENSNKITKEDLIAIEVQVEKSFSRSVIEKFKKIGLKEIANGRVAVIVLAGGQGTRLGMAYPKGMCPTELPSGKTLFQLQAERIKRLEQIAREKIGKEGTIHWYIMTSNATDLLTEKFLQQNEYFGLNKDNVRLFKQAQIPCFDLGGKILMEEKGSVSLAPDGNGGIYKALKDNGVLEEMEKKGIKYVHVHSVDNILIKVADPVFIGKCVKDKVDCGLKVIKKTDPNEPLGLVVKVDQELRVVEYSEIPKTTACLENSSGDGLLFNTGNTCNHFFTVEFLKSIAYEYEDKLRLHMAKKVAIQLGPDGDKVCSVSPNCIKIEKFIFDAISYSKNFLAWQVERAEEFSPVKNSNLCKKDCFSSAKVDLLTLHKSWIENVGGKCNGLGLEVSPLISYEGENLNDYKKQEFKEEEVILSESEKQQEIMESYSETDEKLVNDIY